MLLSDTPRYQVEEPLFEAVRVVLTQRGEPYSANYLQGISGQAFRIAGPCPCAPTCSAAFWVTEIAELFGYEAAALSLTELSGEPLQKAIPPVIERVKAEVRAGRPAILFHAFSFAEFDVVAGFDDDKHEFIGWRSGSAHGGEMNRAPQGRFGTCGEICPVIGAVLIGDKVGEFDPPTAELEALEEAVRYAQSPSWRWLEEIDGEVPWRFRHARACYDVWIRNFTLNPQKTPDGPGDRYPLGICCSTHRAAGGFLRELAPKYPKAGEWLEQAAQSFDRDADALVEIFTRVWGFWGGFKEPDEAKAQRTVELFRAAEQHYFAGMDKLAAALEFLAPERLDRASRRRVLTAVGAARLAPKPDGFRYGLRKDNTFCGTLFAALQHSRQPYTYTDLMGLSGLAFRIRWANQDTKTQWCPSIAVGEMPDEIAQLAEVSGWSLEADPSQGGDQLRQRIVAEIDAGRAVIGYPDDYVMALLWGYEDDGRTLLFNRYQVKETPTRLPFDQLGDLRFYLGEYGTPPPLKEALVETLRLAILHHERERHHGGLPGREYWYGHAAFEAWLENLRRWKLSSDETRQGVLSLDAWNYQTLHHARWAAVEFLGDWSRLLTGPARTALEQARELYQQEVKVLEPLLETKPQGERQHYPPAEREQTITVLTAAQQLETEAVAACRRALVAATAGG